MRCRAVTPSVTPPHFLVTETKALFLANLNTLASQNIAAGNGVELGDGEGESECVPAATLGGQRSVDLEEVRAPEIGSSNRE